VAVFMYGAVLSAKSYTEMAFIERYGMSLGATTVSSVICDSYVWEYICKTSRVVVTFFSLGLSKRNCIVPVHQSASFSAYVIDFCNLLFWQ
jgi:hypothetical protein